MLRYAATFTAMLLISTAGLAAAQKWDLSAGHVNGHPVCGLGPVDFMALVGVPGEIQGVNGTYAGPYALIHLFSGQVDVFFYAEAASQPGLATITLHPPQSASEGGIPLPFRLAWGMTRQQALLAASSVAAVSQTENHDLTIRPLGRTVLSLATFDSFGRLAKLEVLCE